MSTITRLHDPDLADTLAEALAAIALAATPAQLAAVAVACVEGHLTATAPQRQFTAAHLRIVYLLAESQGSTHTRLRRAWDAKSSRVGDLAWPWISDSGIRTRTSELTAWGLVEPSGAMGQTPAGRPSRIWQLTGINPAAIGRAAITVPGYEPTIRTALEALLAEAGPDLTIRTQLGLAAEVAGITA